MGFGVGFRAGKIAFEGSLTVSERWWEALPRQSHRDRRWEIER